MSQPYDWPTLREWLVWYLELFLGTYNNRAPWPEYRSAIASRSLDSGRFAITDAPAREAVFYVTDVINEPCHDAEIRYLARCRQLILDSESAEVALRALEQVYDETFG